MASTRREFLDFFLAYVGAVGDDKARDRAERLLAIAMTTIWSRHPWLAFQVPTPYQFTTVAGVRSYALPDWFGRITSLDRWIRNATHGRRIEAVDPLELEAAQGTTLEAAGVPSRYYLQGTVGVHTQPATAGELLEVVSSDATDVAVRVLIEGLDEDRNWRRHQVTLTGSAPVDLGAWRQVQTFGKSYPEGLTPPSELTTSAGTVTLRTTAHATELQQLLPAESALDLQVLTLVPVPNAAIVIALPVMRRPRPMRYDADVLPDGWEPALLEQLTNHWRVIGGETRAAGDMPTPALLDLICDDNAKRPNTPRRGFRG